MGIGILARPLLASVFIAGGYNQIVSPGGRAKAVKKAAAGVNLEVSPATAETLVKANGAVMAGAGATLALGILPRLSALALAGALVPTTLVGHPFWKSDDQKTRTLHLTQALKNAGLVGGLLLVATRRRKATSASTPSDAM